MSKALFDLDSGFEIDNVMFELLLSSSNDIPVRNQLVEAIRILGEARVYPIFRCLDRVITEEEYHIGTARLFDRLKDVLNGEFH
jgi:hypothetical protein